MKKINQYLITARNSFNSAPLYSMKEIEKLCGSTPSVDIGEIKLNANLFGRPIMKILSVVAVGALVTALFLFNSKDEQTTHPTPQIEIENIIQKATAKQDKPIERIKVKCEKSISMFDPGEIPLPEDNLLASISSSMDDLKIESEEEMSTPVNTLMGYPIMVLSKEEAENIGFTFDDGEITFRQISRLILPFDTDFSSSDDYRGASLYILDEIRDRGYDLNKDSIVFEEIKVGNKYPINHIVEKEDALQMHFNNINALSMKQIRVTERNNNLYIDNHLVASSCPHQLSKYKADEYTGKIAKFEVDQIVAKNLFETNSHFYVDTSYSAASVFKKFVKIIIPMQKEDATVVIDSWFLLTQELASKLPQRFQADIKYKYVLTEKDLYTNKNEQIAVYLDENSNLPWTKVTFIPNHFSIYGTDKEGNYRKIRTNELEKISSYLSKNLPKNIYTEIAKGKRKPFEIIDKISPKTKEIKLLMTLLRADQTMENNINSVELDKQELNKLDVLHSNNEISYFIEYINKNKKITSRLYRYRFDDEEIDKIDMDGCPSNGIMSGEYFCISYKNIDSSKQLHNFNPIIPVAYSLNNRYTFFNSPTILYTSNKSIKESYAKQYLNSYHSKTIYSDIKLPIYVHNGDTLEMIGKNPENHYAFLTMLDRLIPIKIETSYKSIPGPLYLWYLPTTEFLNTLPERYATSIRKELEILDKIENQNIEPEKACSGFDEESFLGLCNLTSGALSKMKIAPNPCIFDLKLSFLATEKRNVSIEVYDINGRNIKIFGTHIIDNFGEQNLTLDISDLKTGIYQLLIISDKGEKISKRFIKQ